MADTPGTGHNSNAALKSFVERIERLVEEKDALTADIAVVRAEAKAAGFDLKVLAMLIRRRRMDATVREEQDALLEAYERVFG